MPIISTFPAKGTGKNTVTIPGGASMTIPEDLGQGPYTIELSEEENGGTSGGTGSSNAITADGVAYDGSQSGISADTVQAAIDQLAASTPSSNASRKTTIIVGTSTNGCTESDCDYLCDGSADDVEINAAIQTAITGGYHYILLKSGTYNLANHIVVDCSTNSNPAQIELYITGEARDSVILVGPYQLQLKNITAHIRNIQFRQMYINASSGTNLYANHCTFYVSKDYAIYFACNIVDIRYCKFYDMFELTGDLEDAYTSGIFIEGYSSNSLIIEGNTIIGSQEENTVTGINMEGMPDIYRDGCSRVSENHIKNCCTAIKGCGVISGNWIAYAKYGILEASIGDVLMDIYRSKIESNILGNITSIGISAVDKSFILNNSILSSDACSSDAIGVRFICGNYVTVAGNSIGRFPTGINAMSHCQYSPYKCNAMISGNSLDSNLIGIHLCNSAISVGANAYNTYSENVSVVSNNILGSTTSAIKIDSRFIKTLVAQNVCVDGGIADSGSNTVMNGNLTS